MGNNIVNHIGMMIKINRRKVGTTDDKSDNGSLLLSRNIGSLFDSCMIICFIRAIK